MFPAGAIPGLSGIASWIAAVRARGAKGGQEKFVREEWENDVATAEQVGSGVGVSGPGFGREATKRKKNSSGEEQDEEEVKERTPTNMVITCFGGKLLSLCVRLFFSFCVVIEDRRCTPVRGGKKCRVSCQSGVSLVFKSSNKDRSNGRLGFA